MLRLVFMGSDAIARPALDWLVSGNIAHVVGVFTQPDRAAGRGQQVRANAIKEWALAHKLPVLQPERMGPDEDQHLQELGPDLSLVMAFGHILKPGFIGIPRLGTLNLHTSLLPHYRGASPIQTATAAGERETGVTLMQIVPQLDAGPVAGFERVPIYPLDTSAEVEAKLAAACVPLLARCLPDITAGTLAYAPQDDSRATYCRKLEKTDGELDFSVSAAVLASRINGLQPWPGCSVGINGQSIKLGLADVPTETTQPAAAPGTVLGADATGLLVATGAGVLRLRRLQRPGGKLLPAGDFLRGFPVAAGTVLPSMPMTKLVDTRPFARRKG